VRKADERPLARAQKRHKAEAGVSLEQARKMKADKAGKTDACVALFPFVCTLILSS